MFKMKKWFKSTHKTNVYKSELQEELKGLLFEKGKLSQKLVKKTSEPYYFIIENNTSEQQKITLFGWYRNKFLPNFGLPEGVRVINAQLRDEQNWLQNYAFTMEEIAHKNLAVDSIRFYLSNEQQQNISILEKNEFGSGTINESPSTIRQYLDLYQFQNTLIDAKQKILSVDGNYSLTITMPPNNTLSISFAPIYKETNFAFTHHLYTSEAQSLDAKIDALKVKLGIYKPLIAEPAHSALNIQERFTSGHQTEFLQSKNTVTFTFWPKKSIKECLQGLFSFFRKKKDA